MSRNVPVILGLIGIFAAASVALAQQPPTRLVTAVAPAAHAVSVAIPAHAVQVAPGVFSLGTSVDSRGRTVEGYVIFHHRAGHNGGPGGGDTGGGDSQCYALFAKDAGWKNPEPYVLNPSNNDGLSDGFVEGVLADGITEWENHAGDPDIFGEGSTTAAPLSADFGAPDNANEVYFASIADENVLAFTLVWGIFGGRPSSRELVEWDMVFDDDYAWGDTEITPAAVWDLLNVGTHELGHAAGLTHPDGTCTEETMYAFASPEETKKRTLNAGDITGINQLY